MHAGFLLVAKRLDGTWNSGLFNMGDLQLNLFKSFFRDESGAAAAEYALLVALVSAAIALAAGGLGTAVSTALRNAVP